MYIDFNVENQKLRRTDNNTVAANSQNAIYARFSFDEGWNTLNKKAIFECEAKALRMALENDECIIPYEVLSEGFFSIGILATKAEEDSSYRRTTNTVNVDVVKGPVLEAENAKEPAPLEIERIEAIAQSVRNDADSGKLNGRSATITIGSVTTLEAGNEATVENTGTDTDAVFNFAIPKGLDGKSLYAIGTEDELKERCAASLSSGSGSIHIVWAGEKADITTSVSGSVSMIPGGCYNIGFVKTSNSLSVRTVTKTASIASSVTDEQIAAALENYLTENPISDTIVDDVLAALPAWEGGSY